MGRRLFRLVAAIVVALNMVATPVFAQAAPLIDPNKTIQENLEDFYPVAVRVIALLAFLGVIYAGYLYITSFGKEDRITEAKNWLIAAVTGIVLILLVPVIIRTIESLPLPGR